MVIPVDISKDAASIARLLKESFIGIADEMRFTKENFPNYVAFITKERLLEQLGNDRAFCFGIRDGAKWVGFVAVAPYGDSYEITRLAVAPKYRHRGYGRALMNKACDKARELGLESIGLGILNENTVLKKWYEAQGFVAGEPFVPAGASFTACGMSKKL